MSLTELLSFVFLYLCAFWLVTLWAYADHTDPAPPSHPPEDPLLPSPSIGAVFDLEEYIQRPDADLTFAQAILLEWTIADLPPKDPLL